MADDLSFQNAGFVVGGEPLGVDLADTVVTITDPPTDLLVDSAAVDLWWGLQAHRLPASAVAPSPAATLELRWALRSLLDAYLAGTALPGSALEVANAIAAAAPTSIAITSGVEREVRWHAGDGTLIARAATASSVLELLSSPLAQRLRRCQNPACSMVFVATDARRRFCTQNICANRVRVARHYQRHRSGGAER